MTQHRILIIEDEETIRRMLVVALSADGYDVVSSDQPSSVAHWLRTQQFDLVLCDYLMPLMDGLEIAREADAAGFAGVFLLFTAEENSPRVVEALANGLIDRVIPKPWSLREIRAVIRAELERVRGG